VFWVISVYFNIRNTLPKSGTFLLGHPVYTLTHTCFILYFVGGGSRQALSLTHKLCLLCSHGLLQRCQIGSRFWREKKTKNVLLRVAYLRSINVSNTAKNCCINTISLVSIHIYKQVHYLLQVFSFPARLSVGIAFHSIVLN